MSGAVRSWHYGVVAQWWAEFNVDGPELACFRTLIERFGQPALDLGCGTGRLLLPYLRGGLDVDGCAVSPDMLAHCEAAAERNGVTPRLYAQAMHELDLPRSYRTIYICSSFGIGGDREHDREALVRIYQHLEPGGALVLDSHQPYIDTQRWKYWLAEHRKDLPEPFPDPAQPRPASDGTTLSLRTRVLAFDPLRQVISYEIEARRWKDDQLIADELHRLDTVSYFCNELTLMLTNAGFTDIEVRDGYDLRPLASDSTTLLFLARKPTEPACSQPPGTDSEVLVERDPT